MHIHPVVVHMRDQKVFKIFVSACKGKKLLVRLRMKWEVNIKMGITEVCFVHVKVDLSS